MTQLLQKIIFIAAVVFIPFSCNDSDDDKIDRCDDMFHTISVKVKYTDNSPVELDSYRVMWGERDITPFDNFDDEIFKTIQKTGLYWIITDDLQSELNGKIVPVTIIGNLDGKEIFSEEFNMCANKCHVDYTDKKELVITVEKTPT